MMMKTLLLAVLTTLFMGSATQASAQLAISDDEAATQRTDLILENLMYQLPQLRGSYVVMGEITASDIDGLDEGSFIVNGGQSYNFLVTDDDATLYLLSGEPVDVSMSTADIAAALEEERLAAERERLERHQELTAFVEGIPVRGNPDAPVTIVEFSDFQCPYCARGFTTVEQILGKYPADVKFVYLHYPLPNHPWARPAAIAAVCAAEQDDNAFWTLHDSYFDNQQTINLSNVLDISREFLDVSGSSIDFDVWSDCASNTESEAYQAAAATVARTLATGDTYGVSGTPGFFVNGHFINGAQPLNTFEELIEGILEEGGR